MRIEKSGGCLSAESHIDFGDDNAIFCRMPYVSLLANKDGLYGWKKNSIGIGIRDGDDYDVGLIYITDDNNFFDVLHELLNWMKDHEQGVSDYIEMIEKLYDFFPNYYGCTRELW